MKYKWSMLFSVVLLALCGGGVYAAEAGMGEEPPAASSSAAVSTGTEKKIKAEDAGKSTASMEETVLETKKEPLRQVSSVSLFDMDFMVRGISLGQRLETVEKMAGKPEKAESGTVRSEYLWKDLTVRFVNDLAYRYESRKDLSLPGNFHSAGAEAMEITGPSILTPRGLTVGSSRENLLRVYGRPARILWDGPKQSFYFVYEKQERMLVFTVKNNVIGRIRISYAEPAYAGKETGGLYGKEDRLGEADFRIAGFSLDTPFHEYSWLVWEKKAMNPEEEVWYYPGFAVRMEKKDQMIHAMFLTDGRMTTYRGISMGDQASTVEAVYGAPEKVEMNAMDGHPQSAYIYFSPDKKKVLIFYIDEKERTVQNILVMGNPQIVSPFQKALDAVNHVRAKNHAEKA